MATQVKLSSSDFLKITPTDLQKFEAAKKVTVVTKKRNGPMPKPGKGSKKGGKGK